MVWFKITVQYRSLYVVFFVHFIFIYSIMFENIIEIISKNCCKSYQNG